ncbi:MAG: hypothetical protein PHP42_12625, partial [Bacteroidota bacterium]|nr:hypothetical protein [Bacteroidota bacterium]
MKHTLFIFTVALAIFSTGCFVYDPTADFVKQRYTNSVAYFNTYYNAQRAFSEAEDEVLTAQKDFRDKSITGSVKQFTISQTARTKFTSSIEKNSKLLTFYPTSKWVDDALLMIGKAYYYMEDDVKAERKFLELFVKYPESSLLDEGQLWYGKCLLRQKKYTEGVKQLENLYAKLLQTNEEIAGQASYELAQYYFTIQNYESANKFYSQALPLIGDDDQRAEIEFQNGKCFDELEQLDKAEKAFASVSDHTASYGLYFQAKLRRIKTLSKQKKYDE